MSETVTVVLPLPPRVLMPNRTPYSRGGRYARAAAIKKYRAQAKAAVAECRVESGPWLLAVVSATFFHNANRRRDTDNYIGSLKSAYDGLVDSGLLVDDDSKHLQRREPTFEIDKESPRVELRIERLQ